MLPDPRPTSTALPGQNPTAGPIRTPPSRGDTARSARPRDRDSAGCQQGQAAPFPGPRRYLQGHGLRRAGGEAQAVPGPQEEPIEVGLAVEEAEEDA